MKIILASLMILLSIQINAQNKIVFGNSVNVDGVIEPAEWGDALEFLIPETEYPSGKVLLKHDGRNLCVAFVFSNIRDSSLIIPEIFIDSKSDSSEKWQPDDFWFHVSAQDCYAVGKREDYTNCRADYLVWRASPNYPFGNKFEQISAFEIVIPFELIGITDSDKVGICFSTLIYPKEKRFNIPKDADEDSPKTWDLYKLEESKL